MARKERYDPEGKQKRMCMLGKAIMEHGINNCFNNSEECYLLK